MAKMAIGWKSCLHIQLRQSRWRSPENCRCEGYPTKSMSGWGGWRTRMRRVWFSREGTTHRLAPVPSPCSCCCCWQSALVLQVRLVSMVLRAGRQAYCSKVEMGGAGAVLVDH